MTNRARRRALIKRLVHSTRISSQEELARLLEEQGVDCTQATLSRDLRDLGIARRNTTDGPVYQLDRKATYIEALRRVVGMEIVDVRHNGSLIVVRTLSGRAEGVAGFLDSWGNARILGTVAGDDTVFVAPA
jgi:transcriptional regulator of arginine metabolism